MIIIQFKDDVYDALSRINRMLENAGLILHLQIVGGAALIFNDITSISTNDIDTIVRIEDQIKEIIEDCSVDINDDAIDFIKDYDDLEFIRDNNIMFSNIIIDYLALGGVLITKMKHEDPEKIVALYYLLEEELKVKMNIDSIVRYIDNLGEIADPDDVRSFLEEARNYL